MAKKSATPSTPAPTRPRRRTATPAARPGGGDPRKPAPTADEIAEAAYQRYLRRGGGHGSDFDDWIEAERELRKKGAR